MAAGKYSAGRIFLQVVPSFKGVQKEISSEVKKYNAAIEKDMGAGAEKAGRTAGRKAAKAQAKTMHDIMRESQDMSIAQQAKYAIAIAKQVGASHAKQREAAEKAAEEEVKLWQKRLADAVRMSNKLNEEQARAELQRLKKLGALQAAAYAEDARRDKKRLDDAQAAWNRLGDMQQKAFDEDRKRARQAERDAAREWKQLGAMQAAAYAEDERRHRKHIADLAKIDKKAADDADRVRKQQERDLHAHRERQLKAEREYNRRRGGVARATLEKAFAGIETSLGVDNLGGAYQKEFDKIRRAAKALQSDLDSGFIDTTEARNRLREVERDLRRIARVGSGSSPMERTNARGALNEIRAMRREYDDLGRSSSRVASFLKGATRDSEDGANAFRIFNYRILGVVSALPLLVPLLAVSAGGLVAFGTAAVGAASGLGVMLLGFSGIGAAVKAYGDVQDNAAKDTLASTKAMRNAARGVRDAQQALTRARSEAARSAEDSSRRIADAEERVADAQRDALKAQQDLAEARRQAQQEQQDLADKIAAGKLDERQALIDLFNAQVDYNAVMASGGSTNLEKEQSSINLERARLAIKNIREENAAMLADQAKGPAASPGVEAAQERLVSAQKRQRDAVQDLADARRDADEQAVDSALRIRDAQERLGDAQAAYQEALTKTGDVGSASMSKLEQALGKLGPKGRVFAAYIASLRDDFYDLRAIAQEGLLPGVQDFMERMIGRYGPGFKKFVGDMAEQMGGFFRQMGVVFTNPAWVAFFDMMAQNAATFSGQFGTVFLNFLTGMVSLMTAFAPVALDMGDAMVRISEAFAGWAAGLKDSKGFESFLAYLEKTGPKVWELLEAIVGAFVNLGIALAPIADKLLDFAIQFFEWIAGMDPETLSALATAIIGFVLASQLAAGVTQLLITVTTPFHSLLGAVAFALVAFGVAMVWAYQHSETFQEVVDTIFGFIRDHWKLFATLAGVVFTLGTAFFGVFKVLSFIHGPLRAIQIMFGLLRVAMLGITGPVGLIVLGIIALVAGLIWAYNNVDWFRNGVNAAFEFIGNAAKWLWEKWLKPYFSLVWKILKDVGAVVWWFYSGVVWPVLELVGAIVSRVFSAWWKMMTDVGKGFGWLGGKIKDVWMEYVDPILDKFGLGAGDLKKAWDTAIGGIGKAWESLKAMVYKPIEFIVNTVINRGFVDNFNKLAEIFGTSKIPRLVLPSMAPAKSKPPATVGGKRVNSGMYDVGGYTGDGAKYAPAGVVHKNEYVIKKESTNRIRSKYGLEVLDYMNRFGEIPGMGYATGGLVQFGRKLQSMGFNVSENKAFGGVAPVHSKNSWHYRDGAVDVNYDGHGQAFETAKINSILGLAKQYGLRTIWQYPNHYDHAHFDVGTGADLGNFAGAASSNPGQGLPWYLDKPLDFMRKAINKFTGAFDLDGVIGDFVTKVPLKVLDFAAEKIQNIISGGNGDFDSSSDKNNPNYGVQQWKSTVLAALSRVGQSQSLVDTVLRRMNQESSGDPKAINLWDVNAKNGDPSKGLMQVIGSTFSAYRDKGLPNDIYNPMSNIVASMRYALARYGSLDAAYNRAGGYADGGLVSEGADGIADNGTMMYDSGGYLPPGLTTVLNLTGKPEPVFTADQFEGMGRGRDGGAKWNLDIDVNGSDVTAADIASEIMWAVDREEHGGKFAGKAD